MKIIKKLWIPIAVIMVVMGLSLVGPSTPARTSDTLEDVNVHSTAFVQGEIGLLAPAIIVIGIVLLIYIMRVSGDDSASEEKERRRPRLKRRLNHNNCGALGMLGTLAIVSVVASAAIVSSIAYGIFTSEPDPQPEICLIPPVADAGLDQMVYETYTIQFNGSNSMDPDGEIIAYEWDFADGANDTGMTPLHNYSAPGEYSVTLTVTDTEGLTDSDVCNITIVITQLLGPVADAGADTITVVGYDTVFNGNQSFDQDNGTIVSYLWDFADGTTATDMITQHAYDEPGIYNTTLLVTDSDGLTDMDHRICEVREMADVVINKTLIAGDTWVALHTYNEWVWLITVNNTGGNTAIDVIVDDTLPAEIGLKEYELSTGTLDYGKHGQGQAGSTWLTWDIGTLAPSESAYLLMTVFTETNPSGRVEFTTAGTYILNEGAHCVIVDATTNTTIENISDSIVVIADDDCNGSYEGDWNWTLEKIINMTITNEIIDVLDLTDAPTTPETAYIIYSEGNIELQALMGAGHNSTLFFTIPAICERDLDVRMKVRDTSIAVIEEHFTYWEIDFILESTILNSLTWEESSSTRDYEVTFIIPGSPEKRTVAAMLYWNTRPVTTNTSFQIIIDESFSPVDSVVNSFWNQSVIDSLNDGQLRWLKQTNTSGKPGAWDSGPNCLEGSDVIENTFEWVREIHNGDITLIGWNASSLCSEYVPDFFSLSVPENVPGVRVSFDLASIICNRAAIASYTYIITTGNGTQIRWDVVNISDGSINNHIEIVSAGSVHIALEFIMYTSVLENGYAKVAVVESVLEILPPGYFEL
ncbi:MAG: PKD domain-containing protein [Euryarchaeota archaeon]|nr:PKD domain-containing protein [Euryarchaeota archaeon]